MSIGKVGQWLVAFWLAPYPNVFRASNLSTARLCNSYEPERIDNKKERDGEDARPESQQLNFMSSFRAKYFVPFKTPKTSYSYFNMRVLWKINYTKVLKLPNYRVSRTGTRIGQSAVANSQRGVGDPVVKETQCILNRDFPPIYYSQNYAHSGPKITISR